MKGYKDNARSVEVKGYKDDARPVDSIESEKSMGQDFQKSKEKSFPKWNSMLFQTVSQMWQ